MGASSHVWIDSISSSHVTLFELCCFKKRNKTNNHTTMPSVLFWLICIFLLILLGVIWCLCIRIRYMKYTTSDWLQHHQKQHSDGYRLLSQIMTCLNKYGITYWLHAGSLLGAMRHQSFIPWDDDMDLGVYKPNKSFLEQKLVDAEFDVKHTFFGFQVRRSRQNGVWVDLFFFYPKGDCLMGTTGAQQAFPREYYYRSEMLPLYLAKFGPLQCPIPRFSHKILKRFYGENWSNQGLITNQHPSDSLPWSHFLALKVSGFEPHPMPIQSIPCAS